MPSVLEIYESAWLRDLIRQVVAEHYRLVQATAPEMCDLVSDCMIRLAPALDRFRFGRANILTYLHKCTKRILIDMHRSDSARVRRDEIALSRPEVVDTPADSDLIERLAECRRRIDGGEPRPLPRHTYSPGQCAALALLMRETRDTYRTRPVPREVAEALGLRKIPYPATLWRIRRQIKRKSGDFFG